MTNKNPYENGVDIPEFVEKNDNDIDMSVFKMADNQNDNFDDDEYDEEPSRKISPKGIMILGGILIVLLLIAAISGWIFGISKNNSLTKLQAEYETVTKKLTEAETTITTLQNNNTVLQAELDKYKDGGSSSAGGETTVSGDKYKFSGDVGVRPSAGNLDEYADFTKLPDNVADCVYQNGKMVTTRDNVILTVSETKEVNGNLWGKVAKNAWIAIKYDGKEFATKQ